MPKGLTPSSVTDYISQVADLEALGLAGEALPSLEALFNAIAERWWAEVGRYQVPGSNGWPIDSSIECWLVGLPSVFKSAFSGHDTEPLGEAWGEECAHWRRSPWGDSLDTEETYWRAMACEIERMARKRIDQLVKGGKA